MPSLKIFMLVAAILVIVAIVAGCTQKEQQTSTGDPATTQDLNKDISSADTVQNDIAAPELTGLSQDLEAVSQF